MQTAAALSICDTREPIVAARDVKLHPETVCFIKNSKMPQHHFVKLCCAADLNECLTFKVRTNIDHSIKVRPVWGFVFSHGRGGRLLIMTNDTTASNLKHSHKSARISVLYAPIPAGSEGMSPSQLWSRKNHCRVRHQDMRKCVLHVEYEQLTIQPRCSPIGALPISTSVEKLVEPKLQTVQQFEEKSALSKGAVKTKATSNTLSRDEIDEETSSLVNATECKPFITLSVHLDHYGLPITASIYTTLSSSSTSMTKTTAYSSISGKSLIKNSSTTETR